MDRAVAVIAAGSRSERATGLVLVMALAAALILPWLGARDVWAPDEPRHAEVAREILRDGHWWYPHVNSRPYPDKPPLYFWLAALAGMPGGEVTELAARVPSAVAGLLTVLLIALLARRLWGPPAGLVAGVALATTWLFAWMSRRVSLDVLLTFLVVLAIWCAVRASDAARERSTRAVIGWLALAGVAAGLSIMTKGPVGLLFLAFAIPPLVVADRRDGARWPPAAGLALAAAAILVLIAWLVPANALGGYDPFEVTREHVVERAAEGRDHAQPPYYYLTTIPLDFLPWSVFAIPAILSAWKARRERDGFLLWWALGPIVVLSLIVEKRNLYVLPLVPAWILLVARWAALQPAVPTAWLRRGVEALWWLLIGIGVACLAAGCRAWWAPLPLPDGVTILWWESALAGLSVLTCAFLLRDRATLGGAARLTRLAVGFALLFAQIFAVLPRLDVLKSGRTMGESIARVVGDAPLGMHPRTWDAYVFYSGHSMKDLANADAIRAFLASSPRPAYLLVYQKDAAVVANVGEPAVEVAADRVGHRVVVLYRFGDSP